MGEGDGAGTGQGEGQGEGQGTGGAPKGEGGLEARVDGLESKVDKVLELLGGKGEEPSKGAEPAAEPAGKSVAEQVREGIERLEADKAAKAKTESAAAELEARLKKLEEVPPAEPATLRQKMQRVIYGADVPGSPAGAGKAPAK